jgi:hypothetical protein
MDDKTALIVALLGSGGLFAVIGAMVNGVFTKRKLGAEATEIITRAASGVVTDLRTTVEEKSADMARMRVEHDAALAAIRLEHTAALTKMATDHATEREDWRRVLQLHVAWDYIAIEKMSHVGIELPPPPPILPPLDPYNPQRG